MNTGTILYVGNFELPDKNAAAHRVVNNGKIFCELGFRTVFLGAARGESFHGVKRAEDAAGSKLNDGGFDFWERAYPASTADWVRQLYDVSDVRAVSEAYADLRLVVAYNLPFATFKALKKAFSGTDVRVAYDCTEWNGYAEGSLPKRLYKKRDEKQIRTKLARECRDVIVISERMEKSYRAARPDMNLLRLPPLVDVEDPIWRQEREEHPGVFEFCFSGTVSNKERLDLVVEAFLSLDRPDVRLRIVGMTVEEFFAGAPDKGAVGRGLDSRRETAFAEQAAIGNIIFDGYLSHAEAVGRTLSCDCCVFIREATGRNTAGFPTKFAEAFTCGVPIITTDVSDVAAYIDSPEKGTVVGASVGEIRAAMDAALTEFRGYTPAVRDTFDYRNHIDGTREWIDRVLTGQA